jgi:putative toxin-antitoxin system antitoxin component (TIGR02293 family)
MVGEYTFTVIDPNRAVVMENRKEFPMVAFAGDTGELIQQMRTGTPVRAIAGVAAHLGVSEEKLLELLRLSPTGIHGRNNGAAMMSPIEQDRIYRAEKVLQRAFSVFGDDGAARSWVSQVNRSLGWEAPLALLDTEVGYELVMDTLGRIEFGVIS